mgnify:FL=1
MKLFGRQETFRILVVAAMMGALSAAAGGLANRLTPSFDPSLLVTVAFLVCLEGISTDRLARRLPEASALLRLHLVEWAVIVVLLRLVLSLSNGLETLAADLVRWLERPQSLVDGGLALAGALLFGVWMLGLQMSRSLETLDPDVEAPPPEDSAAYYAWLTRPQTDRPGEGWQRLVTLFLVGGGAVLIFSGLTYVDIQAALRLQHPATPGLVGNALLYFVLGFVLLAQAHYTMLRRRWDRRGVTVVQTLRRRWITWGLAFVASVAVASLLLPVRPSLALFVAAFAVLVKLFEVLTLLTIMLLSVLGYLFSWLGRLFGSPASGGPATEPLRPMLPPPAPEGQPVAWWVAIQGLVLWAVIVVALSYAVIRFVRDRRGLWQGWARHGLRGWILGLATSIWSWLTRASKQVSFRLRALVSRSGSLLEKGGRPRVAWPRARTARERVRLLYLLALRQAAEVGWARQRHETPYDYAALMGQRLDESAQVLRVLTEAFVQARYAPREFAASEVGPLRALYQRLRRKLRRLASHSPPASGPAR